MHPTVAGVRRWGNDGRSDPVARYVAPRLGLRVATVEQMIRGRDSVFDRCAAIIDGFVALDDHVRLVKAMVPIDAALLRAQQPTLSTNLVEIVRDESQADQSEQIAQDMPAIAPSREAALLFVRRSQTARAMALRLERAVAAQWELR